MSEDQNLKLAPELGLLYRLAMERLGDIGVAGEVLVPNAQRAAAVLQARLDAAAKPAQTRGRPAKKASAEK